MRSASLTRPRSMPVKGTSSAGAPLYRIFTRPKLTTEWKAAGHQPRWLVGGWQGWLARRNHHGGKTAGGSSLFPGIQSQQRDGLGRGAGQRRDGNRSAGKIYERVSNRRVLGDGA